MGGTSHEESRRDPGAHRLVLAVTHPMTARYLLRGQVDFLRRQGFEVWVVCAPGADLAPFQEEESTPVVTVPLRRELAPLADLAALLTLIRALRRLRPDLVNASTPKAGVLGMLAAWLAGVPVRIYTLRGLRVETMSGLSRVAFRWAKRTAAALANRVVCVSPSLRRRVLELGIARPDKTVVLADGSSNGVDLERFRPATDRREQAVQLRRQLGIPPAAPVVGFVGRFTRDKGLADLLAAYLEHVAGRFADCRLLLLGKHETGDPLPEAIRRQLAEEPRIVTPGFVPDSAPYYAVMDLLAFPSYREGFPNAPLEAAASALPTAGYAAIGTVDAVRDGVTGTLVPVGEVAALGKAICAYLGDAELRRRHGAAARRRAATHFDRQIVWKAWAEEYRRLLAAKGGGERR